MAILSTVLPSFMLAYGVRRLGASSASILSSVGPISTVVLSATYLGESVTLWQLLGMSLVVTGVLVLAQKGSNSTP